MRSLSYLNLGEEFPLQSVAGNAAVLEEESQGFTGIYQAVVRGVLLSAFAAQALTAQINVGGAQGDELPVAATQSAFDHDGWQFQPVPLAARYPQQFVADDDFVTVVASDDDAAPMPIVRLFSTAILPTLETEFLPVAAAPGIAFDDDAAPITQFQSLATPRVSVGDEETPQGVAPTFVTDDNDAPLAQIYQARTASAFFANEEFPQFTAPPPALDETDVTIWTPRAVPQQIAPFFAEDEFVSQPRVATDDEGVANPGSVAWSFRPAFFTPEEFPQFPAPQFVTDDDWQPPFLPQRRWWLAVAASEEFPLLVSAPPAATILTGKYKPEHDSALVDLGAAQGFQTEHDSALTDIGNAQGFSSEHASALKDLGDAGV